MTSRSSLLIASMLMLIVITKSDNSKDKEECAESLVGLATCLPYVGGTAKSPTPDCCSGLKGVLKTKKKCLCVVIKNRNDPDWGLSINATLALTLPDVCHAPANVSQCPALLNLPPNSPDAQVFYQLGKNSTHGSASSPVAGGPNAKGIYATVPNPTSGAATVGTNSQPKSGGYGQCRLVLNILLIGLLLLSILIV
ncbi:hypothetical protein ACS0TY_003336 [Phlomoides rotata]